MAESSKKGTQQSSSAGKTALHKTLFRKLDWMVEVWMAVVEAHKLARGLVMTDIKSVDHRDLELPKNLVGLKVSYYEVYYAKAEGEETPLLHNGIAKAGLNEQLVKAELLRRSCTQATYTLWEKVHELLENEPAVNKIVWRRKNIDPPLITFPSGSEIEPLNHDYFEIQCSNDENFVADVAGGQFGLTEWFYTRKAYRAHIVQDLLDPEQPKPKLEMEKLEAETPLLHTVKEAVEECFDQAQAEWWQKDGITWLNIHQCSDDKRHTLYKELADMVRDKVLGVLDEEWNAE